MNNKRLNQLLLVSGLFNIGSSMFIQYLSNKHHDEINEHLKFEKYLKKALINIGNIATSESFPTIESRAAVIESMLVDLKQEFILEGVDLEAEFRELIENETAGDL